MLQPFIFPKKAKGHFFVPSDQVVLGVPSRQELTGAFSRLYPDMWTALAP